MARKPATPATKTVAKKTPAKKAPVKKAAKKAEVVLQTDEVLITNAAPMLSPEVPAVAPEQVDVKDVMITKMQEMMEKMMEQNKILMEQLATNGSKTVSDEQQRETIYKPLRSKVYYKLHYFDYDADGNKILRNPMYEYKEFETMEELLTHVDDNWLGPMGGRWWYVLNRVPMPDEYWDSLDKKENAL